MKRPKLVRDDSGERAGWWLGDRFVPDKPPEVDAWYRARELERELAAASAYAKQMREALEEINLMACYASEEDTDSREAMLLTIGEAARAALDKNPNPSGHLPTEASDFHPEASGPVGLGPDDEHLTKRSNS